MKRILLIEDDNIIRESTAELLELDGEYTVITAKNGVIGIKKAIYELPDIIICDIMMPKTDGFGVLEKLSKNPKTKLIPFIFLSAKTERKEIRKGMNLGADDYITKPFSEEELRDAIKSRLAKSVLIKEITDTEKPNQEKEELKNLNDLKNYFDDNGTSFSFKADDKVYKEGDNSNYIYLIRSGSIKCYKFNKQGKTLTTSIYKDDDFFGYTSFTKNQSYEETAVTIVDTEILGIEKSILINILNKNHTVTLELVDLLTNDLKDVKEQLLEMAYDSVHKKTASTLLKFAEKINRKADDLIKVSRHDLAHVAGISTETLIRSISKLRKEGIVELDGRNIRILDLEALKTIS